LNQDAGDKHRAPADAQWIFAHMYPALAAAQMSHSLYLHPSFSINNFAWLFFLSCASVSVARIFQILDLPMQRREKTTPKPLPGLFFSCDALEINRVLLNSNHNAFPPLLNAAYQDLALQIP
jgi:hypothetical protein